MNFLPQLFKRDPRRILAFSDGKIIHIEDIPDAAFSNRLIGDGLAIEINSSQIYAPCEGIVTVIASTQHAFTITLDNGLMILVHIGLNTARLNQYNFTYHVKVGDHITPQTLILTLSDKMLEMYNYKVIVPIVILNHNEHPIRTMTTSNYIKRGKTLFTYK